MLVEKRMSSFHTDFEPDDIDRFTYNEVRSGNKLLVVCTCNDCGASKVVSFDGTLNEWEQNHDCRMTTVS